jgi:hypothetical protein
MYLDWSGKRDSLCLFVTVFTFFVRWCDGVVGKGCVTYKNIDYIKRSGHFLP